MTQSREMGPGAQSEALADRLRTVETENVTWLGPGFPLFWNSADGVWVRDADEQSYLDMTAAFGVCALGHGSAVVRKALHEQVDTLIHGMGDVHPPKRKVELLEKLVAIFNNTNFQRRLAFFARITRNGRLKYISRPIIC